MTSRCLAPTVHSSGRFRLQSIHTWLPWCKGTTLCAKMYVQLILVRRVMTSARCRCWEYSLLSGHLLPYRACSAHVTSSVRIVEILDVASGNHAIHEHTNRTRNNATLMDNLLAAILSVWTRNAAMRFCCAFAHFIEVLQVESTFQQEKNACTSCKHTCTHMLCLCVWPPTDHKALNARQKTNMQVGQRSTAPQMKLRPNEAKETGTKFLETCIHSMGSYKDTDRHV